MGPGVLPAEADLVEGVFPPVGAVVFVFEVDLEGGDAPAEAAGEGGEGLVGGDDGGALGEVAAVEEGVEALAGPVGGFFDAEVVEGEEGDGGELVEDGGVALGWAVVAAGGGSLHHTHIVSGSTLGSEMENDSHSHDVDSGVTGSGGSAGQENRPPFYALVD